MLLLGQLAIPAGASVNNHTTAVPFDLGRARAVYLVSDSDALYFTIAPGRGTDRDELSAFVYDAPLYDSKDPYAVEGPFPVPQYGDTDPTASSGGKPVVRIAVFNSNAVTAYVNVYSA